MEEMKKPIGIFDSGVGGLTVFKEIRNRFPYEDIIYFGDTARVPYGPKSASTIIEYSIQNSRFLLQNDCKAIIVACNTSSAVALDSLKSKISVPVLGVIEPGVQTAIRLSHKKKIGIIGTEGTIRSQAYQKRIKFLEPESEVFAAACPLFVPLVEEGWEYHHVTKLVIAEYLTPMLENEIDVLILGCTHYPILKKAIADFLGNGIKLIDSAMVVAEYLPAVLTEKSDYGIGRDLFFVSDNEQKFKIIATRILGKNLPEPVRVRLNEGWFA